MSNGLMPATVSLSKTVDSLKKEALTAALQACAGNLSKACEALGVNRNYARRLIAKFELKPLLEALRAAAGVSSKGGRPWPCARRD